MLIITVKQLTCCIEMCNSVVFKSYFLMIFSIVEKWWALMKQLNTTVWICNIEMMLCKMIMTVIKVWSYCLSVVNCMTENRENTILIESLYLNHLQSNCRECRHKICLSLWIKQNSIKIDDEACENLHTVSHCWHLKKTFERVA